MCSNNKTDKETVSWQTVARRNMVQKQIIERGITDTSVINAMLSIERHKFVPKEYENNAYADYPLPIGEEQTISQPYVVALMTELLALNETDRVLEIGTGSGYQAAILSIIVKDVYTIEIVPSLAQSAQERLKDMGFTNVHVKCGDGFLGWPEAAPFDAIIITCAPPEVPQLLIEQLTEGGRLIVPLGSDFQMLTLYKKAADELQKTEIVPVRFVPMKGLIEEKSNE
ncbi:protein-L-isoaspartate O-methyltransferase [candidate division TA06 bacterium DG_78]|uniref:Protein-L-isoaspartate O-methyltransferase n=1 Tax=candidate division TA06 bacterium DG_78 TaxID=1703772 RepID=A0A0S7YDP5_UNCT6|nr:MAG: protein-L-isoaspartate O-methyltransferase [candidate division TA06 bacterium DG_78]